MGKSQQLISTYLSQLETALDSDEPTRVVIVGPLDQQYLRDRRFLELASIRLLGG